MTDKDNGGPAFPQALTIEEEFSGSQGMTLRDYFAAKALQGLIACPQIDGPCELIVADAYRYADAMLAERQK